jgi:1,4-alpha-glucan branching enzyme
VRLRLNFDGFSKGLCGQHIQVHHVNNQDKMIAFLRHQDGGPNDHTLIVANFSARDWAAYEVGVPQAGHWAARFNSDWAGYREDLGDFSVQDIMATALGKDDLPARASISVAAYSLSIYTLCGD